MSLSRIDARFLLPVPPGRVALLPGGEGWAEPLARVGIEVSERPSPDLAVAASRSARLAAATHARALVLEGTPLRRLSGYATRRFLAFPSLEEPVLLLPLDSANVCSYAIENWTFPATRARALRKRVLVPFARPAVTLLRRPGVTVATPRPGQPFLVAAAVDRFGLEPDLEWFLVCGQGDALARGVFVLFSPGGAEPGWVVKFARMRGYAEPFDRDERGLELVAAAGGAAARRASRLVGRFVEDGLHASVETAGVGAQLSGLLGGTLSQAKKLEVVEAVCAWIVHVGLETRGSSADELERLRSDVLPAWDVADRKLLSGLDGVPGVLQHNDLGAWNIVVDRSGEFTVLDWEDARGGGLPLWDLWYFLADTLPVIDGEADDRLGAFLRLFRGEAPSSPLLFRLTRIVVETLGIPPDAVGRLATLCWLHHGLSQEARAGALDRHAGDGEAIVWPPARYAPAWLEDPELGPDWKRWRDH